MFSKHRNRNKTKLPTIVGEETQFTGDIISTGEVQIDGEVIGDIHAAVLKVGALASIKGNITAEQIEHHGKIIGNVQTSDIHLVRGSRIEGDVLHFHITIETGAFINGVCQHISPEALEEMVPEALEITLHQAQQENEEGFPAPHAAKKA